LAAGTRAWLAADERSRIAEQRFSIARSPLKAIRRSRADFGRSLQAIAKAEA
jgi:hypothetical protein